MTNFINCHFNESLVSLVIVDVNATSENGNWLKSLEELILCH